MPNLETTHDTVPVPIQLLDFVFDLMKNREFHVAVNSFPPSEIMQLIHDSGDAEKKLYFNRTAGKLLFDILTQLEEDKYISYNKPAEYNDRQYYTTFKGGLHSFNGGYSTQYLNHNQAKNHAEQLEKVTMANNKWMRIGTLGAALVAFFLLLIEIAKHYHALLKIGFGWVLSIQMMTFLFVAFLALAAGVLLGAALTVTIQRQQ